MSPDTHLAPFTIERLWADDLDASQAQAARTHLDACAECRAIYEGFEREAANLHTEVPYAAFRIEHERRRAAAGSARWRASWTWGLVGAVAATLLIVAVPRHATEPRFDTRIKGAGVGLDFVVQTKGRLQPGVVSQKVEPGAILQLRYDAGSFRYMAVVGIDPHGAVSVYYPDGSDQLGPLPAGPRGEVPFSLTLDATPGRERFCTVYAHTPVPLSAVTDAASQAAQNDDPNAPWPLPRGVAQACIWVYKP